MPDIFELVDPAELVAAVRALTFPRFTLASVFPRRNTEDVLYDFMSGNADTTAAAPVRSFDAEAPIGKRPGLTRIMGQLPPISQKIPLSESDRIMLAALRSQGSAEQQRLVDTVFNDAARMARSVEARVELARGDALADGIITIDENGMQFTIDYGVPSDNKVTPAAADWDDPTADIIGDLALWVQAYIDLNGVPPERAITSAQVIAFMLRNEGIRILVTGNTDATLVTQESLRQVLTAFNLPAVEPYDVQVYDSTGTKARVIPEDRFIMLPGQGDVLGPTLYGVTAEAMELASQGLIGPAEAPGLVAVIWKTTDPVAIWTKGAAIALPIIANPDALFVATVTGN